MVLMWWVVGVATFVSFILGLLIGWAAREEEFYDPATPEISQDPIAPLDLRTIEVWRNNIRG